MKIRENIQLKKLSDFKYLLRLLWLLTFVFFLLYEIFLRSELLVHFSTIPDKINKIYYTAIFSNLEYPIIFTLIVISLCIIFYEKIKKYLYSITGDKPFLFAAIILTIIIQIALIIGVQTKPIADSEYYIEFGRRLFETGSYIKSNGSLTAFWPVGLPAYIAFLMLITSKYLLLAKLINIVITVLFIIVLYFLFKEEFSLKGRIIFTVFFALYPNNLFSVNCIMADYPFTFLLWLAVFLMIKRKNSNRVIIIIAFILGIMSYLRPVGLLLPLIFAVFLLKYKEIEYPLKKIFLLFLIFTLVMAPWIIRNYYAFKDFVPVSTNGGFNFLMGNREGAFGNVNFNFRYNDIQNEVEAGREAYSRAFNAIIQNPLESLIRVPEKIFFTYDRGDSSITWALKQTTNNISPIFISFVFFAANYLFYFLIGTGIIILFFKLCKAQDKRLVFFIISLYTYFILIVIIYVGAERYLIPVLPVHFFLTGKYFS